MINFLKKSRQSTVLVVSMLFLTQCVFAQDDPGTLTLERIFTSNEFQSERFGPARWLEDGSGYTTLEASTEEVGGREIIKYNPKNGDRSILVGASSLIPEGMDKPLSIRDYHWSPDGKKLLIFTNTKRVWRRHTRGDYWVMEDTGMSIKWHLAHVSPEGRLEVIEHTQTYRWQRKGNGKRRLRL